VAQGKFRLGFLGQFRQKSGRSLKATGIALRLAEQGADIVVFGINETSAPVTANLRYGLLNVAGG